jgi:hypothetical protein
MKKNALWGRGVAVAAGVACSVALAKPLLALDGPDEPKVEVNVVTQQDNPKVDRELADLEAQRTKIDQKIRELRRQSGRAGSYRVITPGTGNIVIPSIPRTPTAPRYIGPGAQGNPEEWHRVAEKAMEEARRAMEQAFKDMPKGAWVLPRDGRSFVFPKGDVAPGTRVYVDKDGKILRSDEAMSPAEREKMRKALDEMREKMRTFSQQWKSDGKGQSFNFNFDEKNLPGFTRVAPATPAAPGRVATPRVFTSPRVYTTPSPDVRNEVRELRNEVQQLREELRRERERKGTDRVKRDEKSDFLNGVNLL